MKEKRVAQVNQEFYLYLPKGDAKTSVDEGRIILNCKTEDNVLRLTNKRMWLGDTDGIREYTLSTTKEFEYEVETLSMNGVSIENALVSKEIINTSLVVVVACNSPYDVILDSIRTLLHPTEIGRLIPVLEHIVGFKQETFLTPEYELKATINGNSFMTQDLLYCDGVDVVHEITSLRALVHGEGWGKKAVNDYIDRVGRDHAVICVKAEPMYYSEHDCHACDKFYDKVEFLVKYYESLGFVSINGLIGYEGGVAMIYANQATENIIADSNDRSTEAVIEEINK